MNTPSIHSYVSAGALPWKLLQAKEFAVVEGAIRPIHLQLIPTNRCNGNCSWCSCSEVDRSVELKTDEILEILHYFKARGTKAITITGGGEPTLHQGLLEIVRICRDLNISVGLVTNGLLWARGINPEYNRLIDWVRVSTIGTDRENGQSDVLRSIAISLPNVSVGASFTVDRNVCLGLAESICRVSADIGNITHVRFVQNILDPDVASMDNIERHIIGRALSGKAIFQRRSDYESGAQFCRMPMLKPMVDADGIVYPCCGVQYASEYQDELRKMPARYRMGHWTSYDSFKPFDGSICRKCYYGNYNRFLEGLTTKVDHLYHV